MVQEISVLTDFVTNVSREGSLLRIDQVEGLAEDNFTLIGEDKHQVDLRIHESRVMYKGSNIIQIFLLNEVVHVIVCGEAVSCSVQLRYPVIQGSQA
ncbi:hypothetical protein ES703_54392 [subsurface metagenome]